MISRPPVLMAQSAYPPPVTSSSFIVPVGQHPPSAIVTSVRQYLFRQLAVLQESKGLAVAETVAPAVNSIAAVVHADRVTVECVNAVSVPLDV